MSSKSRWAVIVAISFACLAAAGAEPLQVDAKAGNSTMSAVFDAPLGERIMALSNAVGCDLTWDEKTGMSGTCAVPLSGIRVDNDDTKSEHFSEWATNKKSDPKTCKLEAKFSGAKPAKALAVDQAVEFSADIPFTICGRGREDGKPEHVTGTVTLMAGKPDSKTLRIRAHVEKFNRESYHVGPKWTDGWLAHVQDLVKVVAPEGTIDLNLFASTKAK